MRVTVHEADVGASNERFFTFTFLRAKADKFQLKFLIILRSTALKTTL